MDPKKSILAHPAVSDKYSVSKELLKALLERTKCIENTPVAHPLVFDSSISQSLLDLGQTTVYVNCSLYVGVFLLPAIRQALRELQNVA